jgi:hypothetical protein
MRDVSAVEVGVYLVNRTNDLTLPSRFHYSDDRWCLRDLKCSILVVLLEEVAEEDWAWAQVEVIAVLKISRTLTR